jgi:hypothetical protein
VAQAPLDLRHSGKVNSARLFALPSPSANRPFLPLAELGLVVLPTFKVCSKLLFTRKKIAL